MGNRFYSSKDWHKLRGQVIRRDYVHGCRICRKPFATRKNVVVDHIVPRRSNPDLALEPSNMQLLCGPCHSSIKQHIEKTPDVKPIGLDGFPDDWR